MARASGNEFKVPSGCRITSIVPAPPRDRRARSIGALLRVVVPAVLLAACTEATPPDGVGVSRDDLRMMASPNDAAPETTVQRITRLAEQEPMLRRIADESEHNVRTALAMWTDQLRAALPPEMHTVVAGLVDDPDCQGDIVKDRLIERYFDALFSNTDDQPAQIVAALSALARQSACLGSRQSAVLASTLYATYNQVREDLHQRGSDAIIPYLAQAASQPLLLFYDVEKYRGAASPLARWFAENREILKQGVLAQRHPAIWHRLWLYDRRSGRLLGYKHSWNPRDENDIDLVRFWTSISSLESLGNYGCSFMEMVGRGANSVGYFCSGSKCKTQTAPAGKQTSTLASGSFTTSLPKQAGSIQASASPDRCEESSPGGGDRETGGVCGQGLNIGGDSWASDSIGCLTSQIVRPGTEMMKCMSEAMGLCSNPVDKLTKELRQAEFSGTKIGANCQISAGMGDVKAAEQKKQEEAAAAVEKAKQAADKAQAEAEAALKIAEEAEKKANEAKAALEAAEKAGTATQADRNGVWLVSGVSGLANIAYSNAVSKMQQADKDYLDAKHSYEGTYGGSTTNQRCPIDTPECGNNNCTGMSDSMRQTLDCVKQATDAETRDPFAFQHGGCDPRHCDPMEPGLDGHASTHLSCFAPTDNGVEAAVTKRCWAVDCAGETETVLDTSGLCNCQPRQEGSPDGHLRGMCDTMHCAEGSPKAGPIGCTCEGSTPASENPRDGNPGLPGVGIGQPTGPGTGTVPVPTQPGQPPQPGIGPWPL